MSARARRRPRQGDSGRRCSGCRRTPGTATSKVTLTGNDARGRFHAQKERRPTAGGGRGVRGVRGVGGAAARNRRCVAGSIGCRRSGRGCWRARSSNQVAAQLGAVHDGAGVAAPVRPAGGRGAWVAAGCWPCGWMTRCGRRVRPARPGDALAVLGRCISRRRRPSCVLDEESVLARPGVRNNLLRFKP